MYKLLLLIAASGLIFGCANNCSPVGADGSYSCDEEDYEEEEYADYEDEESDGGVVVFISGSSEEEYYDECYDYERLDNCHSKYDTWANVLFKVGSNQGRKPVKVTVYEGTYPDGEILMIKENPSYHFSLDLNVQQLAAAAFYVVGKDTIVAVDGSSLKFSKEEVCGLYCYSVEDETLDLRLDD